MYMTSSASDNASLLKRAFVDTIATSFSHVWLQAPVGYGKTITAQQILAARKSVPLTLRLETAHGDISYLIQALASRYCAQIEHQPFDFPPRSLSSLIDHIVQYPAFDPANISSKTPKTCLFIENFEAIAAAPDARDGLARALLDHLPELDLIVTSQVPLTGIWQRFASCPSFCLVPAEQLAFTPYEIESLARQRLSCSKTQTANWASVLYDQTHGWPSETSYALEQIYRSSEATIPSSQVFLELDDRFATELISGTDADLQSTLALLSLLPPLSMDKIVSFFGIDTANQLDTFRRQTALLHFETTPNSSDHQQDRSDLAMHPRLRASLSQRPWIYAPEGQRQIAQLAEKLLTASQEDLALDLIYNAGCVEAITAYILKSGANLLQTGRLVLLGKLISKLPNEIFAQTPPLKFFRAVTALQSNPFAAIEDFEASYHFAKDINDPELTVYSWAMLIDAIWFAWSDGSALDPLIDGLPTIKALVEGAKSPVLESFLSRGAFTALSLRQPDHPEFKHWEQRSLLDLQKQAPRHEVARRGTQMLIHLIYGPADKHNAELVLRRVRQFHDGKNETAADHCSYYVVKSSFDAWFSADKNAGPTIAYTGLNVSADLGVPYWDALLINAALYRLAPSEDRDSINIFIDLLEERIGPTSRSQDSAILHHFLAYRAWLDGNLNQAEQAITLALNIVTDSGFVLAPLFFKPGYAVILHEQGKTDTALALLEESIHQAEQQHTLLAAFIAKMVKATILAKTAAKKSQQEDAIRDAFALGAKTELMSVPWLRIDQRNALCKAAIAMKCEADYAENLMGSQQSLTNEEGKHALQIRTLGIPDILKDGTSILTSRKPQKIALLAISHLVASGNTGITSERMIELLWPETEPDAGKQRLKAMLYRLRAMLGEKDAVSVKGGTIALNRDKVRVDAWDLIAACQKYDLQTQKQAISLYNGMFFDGFLSHPDLIVYRAHLESLMEGLLIKIADDQTSMGDFQAAFDTYENGLYRLGANLTLLSGALDCLDRLEQPEKQKVFYEKWAPAFRDAFDIEINKVD